MRRKGPFNAVNTSGVLVGPENSVVEAFSYSFGSTPDFFLKAPLANEHPEVVNPVDAAYSIDDAGEIGGFVSSNPRPGPPKDYGFIFDPAEPSGKQVTLIPESLQVLGLWPRWAEVQRNGDVAVLDRSNGVLTTTNLESGDQPPDPFPGNGIASDGTLAGNIVTPGGTPVVSPTLRYTDGSELTLEIPGFAVGDAEDVNESHYAVGNVQLEGHRVEAALWTPTGHLELLKELIPSGSGWVLRNAIAIANDGVIAGTGELEGKEHSFLLTVGSTLPTTTGVSCAPASPRSRHGRLVHVHSRRRNPRGLADADGNRHGDQQRSRRVESGRLVHARRRRDARAGRLQPSPTHRPPRAARP